MGAFPDCNCIDCNKVFSPAQQHHKRCNECNILYFARKKEKEEALNAQRGGTPSETGLGQELSKIPADYRQDVVHTLRGVTRQFATVLQKTQDTAPF